MDTVSSHPSTFEFTDEDMHPLCFRPVASPVKPARSPVRPRCSCPVYGVRASAGRRARMEDALTVVENFLEVSRPKAFWKSQRKGERGHTNGASPVRQTSTEVVETEVCHFFGVYDGHNGPYAAHHCRGRLHENFRAVYSDLTADSESVAVLSEATISDSDRIEVREQTAERRRTMETTEEDVFRETFRRTDRQFSEYRCAERVGTTALAALVGSKHIAVGSCGDSRAVMYRSGKPIQLSNDHRLDVREEKERIESLGGKVTYWNGPRVMGVLAMSRAIGDLCFRPYGVICDPEVGTIARSMEDEYLLMATDGLWDVLTNEEAYGIIRHTIASNRAQGVGLEACIQSSANRLTRIALDRGSRDNITVVLLDLQSDDSS